MTGMIVPTVTIAEASVPDWVPDAIRRTRRRPPGTPLSWPAEVPEAVLAVRLARDGSSPLRPWTNANSLVVMIDEDEDNGIATLPYPTMWVAAAGLTPGRRTFTANICPDDEEDEHDPNVQPVTLDIRPGTLVYVEGTPQVDGRPGTVSLHVVPSGLTQKAVKAALTRRLSKGSLLERVANGFLANVDSDESRPAVPDEPSVDTAAVRARLLVSLASQTWVGTARRREVAPNLVGGFVIVAVVPTALTIGLGRDELSSLPVELADLAGFYALLGLAFVLAIRPITLTVGAQGVSMTQGRTQVSAALDDVDWVHSVLEDDRVVLAVCPDRVQGPRPAIAVNMPGFTKEQREQILELLRRASDAYAGVSPPGDAGWMGVTPERSWVTRSALAWRIVLVMLWAGGIFMLLALGLGGMEEGDVDVSSAGGVWMLIGLAASGVILTVAIVHGLRQYWREKVTVNLEGVRIERRSHPITIAFRDIKSVMLYHTGDPGVTIGPDADNPSIKIEPKRDLITRTGMRRGGSQWELTRDRFRKHDFEEMVACLGQGVEAAGGDYYRG